ncbi:hypothetical protein [Actinocrispum sp. NPDC049592]|uniref:hypothetical protein n=1 Tax=Actinocrispum sp. NPDC049592 TaxID=3154835 RepID=UPI00342FA845
MTARNVLANQSRRHGREVLTDEIDQLSGHAADAEVVERLTLLSALAELTGKEREALMLTVWTA